MQGLCGDMEGYEEALRALYRSDSTSFASAIAHWPQDVRLYIDSLLGPSMSDQAAR
jgi:hypothetical protein